MDAVGADNDIGLRLRAVSERYQCDVAALFIADAAMAGMNDADRQRFRQELDQIGRTSRSIPTNPSPAPAQ